MPISDRLKTLRKNKGLTQEEVGLKLDPQVTKAAVASWESGKAKPRADKLQQLADLFGVTVSDLMGEDAPAIVGSSATLQKVAGGGSSMNTPVEVPSWVAERWPRGFFVVADAALSRRYPAGDLLLVDPDTEPENGRCGLFEVEGERVARVALRGASTTVLAADALDGTWPDIVSADSHPPVTTLGAIVWHMADR